MTTTAVCRHCKQTILHHPANIMQGKHPWTHKLRPLTPHQAEPETS